MSLLLSAALTFPVLPNPVYSHRAELARLKEGDAEFHDFLKQNDPDLLTFDLSEDEVVSDSDDSGGIASDVGGDSEGTGDDSDMDVIETPPPSVTSYPQVSQWGWQLRAEGDVHTDSHQTPDVHVIGAEVKGQRWCG